MRRPASVSPSHCTLRPYPCTNEPRTTNHEPRTNPDRSDQSRSFLVRDRQQVGDRQTSDPGTGRRRSRSGRGRGTGVHRLRRKAVRGRTKRSSSALQPGSLALALPTQTSPLRRLYPPVRDHPAYPPPISTDNTWDVLERDRQRTDHSTFPLGPACVSVARPYCQLGC